MSTSPPIVTERTGKKISKTEFAAGGALVQLLGVISFFLIPWLVGVPVGVVLLVIGHRMSVVHKCSECGEKVDKDAKLCRHCQARFE